MARKARQQAESNWYHVTTRGAGRRSIFEDDNDRKRFLDMSTSAFDAHGAHMAAWCLMDNHCHFLARAELPSLQKAMHSLNTKYAMHFNARHGHCGPVFGDRFASFPIESEPYLLDVVRYIHMNPKDIRPSDPLGYPWSSYQEFLTGELNACQKDILDLFGGLNNFTDFHTGSVEVDFVKLSHTHIRLTDREARKIASCLYGESFADDIAEMPPHRKTEALTTLNAHGLSTRQIERLTGIGRWTVRKACER